MRASRLMPAALGVLLLAGAAIAATPTVPALDFRLVDPQGRTHALAGFPPDQVLAIYFGYTTCLRACPVALDNIAAALAGLGPQAASVQPVFVDLDPERMDPVNLAMYMESFGPRFLGLTGSPQAVAEAVSSFKVQVERLQLGADPTDYAMTHLSPIFVMRPGDREPRTLPATSPADAIEAALRAALGTGPPG